MDNSDITNHAVLLLRIKQLRGEKIVQEAQLKQNFDGYMRGLDPVEIGKGALRKLVTDSEVQLDMVKLGLNILANYIIDKIMGKHGGVKQFFGGLNHESGNSNLANIFSEVVKCMQPDNTPKEDTDI